MTLARTQYEIRLYTVSSTPPHFTLAGVLAPALLRWPLRYRVAVNSLGSWTATLADAASDAAGYFARNTIIEIRRRPAYAAWRTEFVGLVKYRQINGDEKTVKLTVGGPDLNWLLQSRKILTDAGTGDGLYHISDNADRAMKNIVYNELAPAAAAARQFPGLLVGAYTDAGNLITENVRLETVLDVLKRITLVGALDFWFDFVPPEPPIDGRIVFQTGQIGTDRRESVCVPLGAPYFIFSDTRGNILDYEYMDDWREAGTSAIVQGAGEGANQELYTYPPAGLAYGAGAWDRNEITTTAREAEAGDVAALTTAGATAVAAKAPVQALTFSARQTESARYGVHYFVGDRVTGYLSSEDVVQEYRVMAVQVWLPTSGGETISPELEQI